MKAETIRRIPHAFNRTLDRIADMIIEAMERAGEGERVNLYFHAGDGEGDAKTAGFYNTAGAGIILDKLCDEALTCHAFGGCDHCDAGAFAIREAQAAYRRVIEAAGHSHCGTAGRDGRDHT